MSSILEVNLDNENELFKGVEHFFGDVLTLSFITFNTIDTVLKVLPASILRDRLLYVRINDLHSFPIFCDIAEEHFCLSKGDFESFPMPDNGFDMTKLFESLTVICLNYIKKNKLCMNDRDSVLESVCTFLRTEEFKQFERQEITLDELKESLE